MTRYEQIHEMTQTQLAVFLCTIHGGKCENCPFSEEKPEDYRGLCTVWWLEQEVPDVSK